MGCLVFFTLLFVVASGASVRGELKVLAAIATFCARVKMMPTRAVSPDLTSLFMIVVANQTIRCYSLICFSLFFGRLVFQNSNFRNFGDQLRLPLSTKCEN